MRERTGPGKGLQPSRREFLAGALGAGAMAMLPECAAGSAVPPEELVEFCYDQVRVTGATQVALRRNVTTVLMGLNEDSLMKPFRAMNGREAPGESLGGWYAWKADYDFHHDEIGLAPAASFGQWTSALARFAAAGVRGEPGEQEGMAERVRRLHGLLAQEISSAYFRQTRFPGYSFDKLVCGLMDAHRLLGDTTAFETLGKVREAAELSLPGYAVARETQWKIGADPSWLWDETYTMPENLYLVTSMGAGEPCRELARRYLLNEQFFEPLARGRNVLSDRHAYSYVNALCSAMQAYFVDGSRMHLAAAMHGYEIVAQQSFATGGWGPDELLRKPGYDEVFKSLTASHNSFETCCGSYAQMKLTRYLLRATRDSRYGDSMERVLFNTVLGALPLMPDGRSFYYADYNVSGKRVYSLHRWPCCSGTLPQVVADLGINTYLHDAAGPWVILYQPSELHWQQGGTAVSLRQDTGYLESGCVRIAVTCARPVGFPLRLRVPAWAGTGARLRINGQGQPMQVQQGFARVDREWRSGDRVELELPIGLRLETFPEDDGHLHAETVALMWGPLVLFAVREPSDAGPLLFTPQELLSARRAGPLQWVAQSAKGMRSFVPFTMVGEAPYSTYVQLGTAVA